MTNDRRLYAARPINTYVRSADVGTAFVEYLAIHFTDCEFVDPNSPEIQKHAKELKEKHSIDPATGEYSEKYYNEVGGAKVMEYFTNEVVGSCFAGAGLTLPVIKKNTPVFMVGAGVAAELVKMFQSERTIWIVTCSLDDGQMNFSMHYVIDIELDETRSTSKSPVWLFETKNGVFAQMTVDETRARMYTPKPDGGWDRDNLQSYFL